MILIIESDAGGGLDAAKVSKSTRLIRLIRLVRLMRMVKVPRLFDMLFEKILSENPALMPIVQIFTKVLSILSFAHLLACCWFALGSAQEGVGWVFVSEAHDLSHWHQ